MKNFTDYLLKTKKVYSFKVKLAVDEVDLERLKGCLHKFIVKGISTPKRTPIQRKPLDFPSLENTSVSIIDLELEYPTVSRELEFLIHRALDIPLNAIKVTTGNECSSEYESRETSPIMGKDYPTSDNSHLVGQKRISGFLKNLVTGNYGVNKTQTPDYLPDAQPSLSPIGSTKRNSK